MVQFMKGCIHPLYKKDELQTFNTDQNIPQAWEPSDPEDSSRISKTEAQFQASCF